MTARLLVPILGLVVAAVVLPTGPAWADAIDGAWCHTDGRRMTIRGPKIVTPGGTRMTGNYDRHAFAYTVPKAEPGAGAAISMILVDENTVRLTLGAKSGGSSDAPVQIWRRCARQTS